MNVLSIHANDANDADNADDADDTNDANNANNADNTNNTDNANNANTAHLRLSRAICLAYIPTLNNINLYNFDLSQLVKRSFLTMLCIISKNRLKIKTYTLINTRANSYIFIDYKLAEKASQFLNIFI
jgi:hypothetical protein